MDCLFRCEGETMAKPWERQPWFERYRIALLETDSLALPARIETAEAAIRSRMAELGRRDKQELDALRNALSILPWLIEEETKKWV